MDSGLPILKDERPSSRLSKSFGLLEGTGVAGREYVFGRKAGCMPGDGVTRGGRGIVKARGLVGDLCYKRGSNKIGL